LQRGRHGRNRADSGRGGGRGLTGGETRRGEYVEGRGGARRGWDGEDEGRHVGTGSPNFRGPLLEGRGRGGEGRGARGEGRGACAFGMRSGRFAARGESRESRTASSATCHDVPRDVPRFDDGLVAAAAPGQSAVRGRQAQTRRPHDARHALDRPPVRLALGPRGSKARGRAWEGVQRLGSCG